MLGLPILDVAIGLIFIFLLLSLVVTAANELIASWLKRRATTLYRGIVRLLTNEETAKKVYAHPLISSLQEKPWLEKYRDKLPFKKRPSYIPSRTFALVLLDVLAPPAAADPDRLDTVRAALQKGAAQGGIPGELAKALSVLLEDAGNDLEEFKKSIEVWFNSSMDRVSGWYKRRTQWILLLLAVIVTVAMNADTLVIAQTLWRDPAMRTALVSQAQQYADQQRKQESTPTPAVKSGPSEPPDVLPYDTAEKAYEEASQKFNDSVAAVRSLPIPLGWRDPAQADDIRERRPDTWSAWSSAVGAHGWGWLLTTLAISLGAPFWFDMLNKVIGIRAAGKAPEEKPKPPKKVPAPVEPGGLPAEP